MPNQGNTWYALHVEPTRETCYMFLYIIYILTCFIYMYTHIIICLYVFTFVLYIIYICIYIYETSSFIHRSPGQSPTLAWWKDFGLADFFRCHVSWSFPAGMEAGPFSVGWKGEAEATCFFNRKRPGWNWSCSWKKWMESSWWVVKSNELLSFIYHRSGYSVILPSKEPRYHKSSLIHLVCFFFGKWLEPEDVPYDTEANRVTTIRPTNLP